MNIPFNPPTPLRELTPELKELLKARVENNLANLIAKLSGSIFYRGSHVLKPLRDVLEDNASTDNRDSQLLSAFYSRVPFTSYDDYLPYVTRFLQDKCKLSEVNDLFAPGLPLFIAHSSGTSGSAPKYFLKYPHPVFSVKPWNGPDPYKITMCGFNSLRISRVVEVVNGESGDEENSIQDIPISLVSSAGLRCHLGIGPRDDPQIVNQKASFSPTPFAVWLIPSYHSNIHINCYFALIDPSIILMNAPLSTMLYDATRIIEENWDNLIDAIEKGYLPEVPDLGEYKSHIEAFVKPHPARGQELRGIQVGQEGWLKKVWPSLVVIRVTLSGPYATLLPKLRHHFGPTVSLQSAVYAATESSVGLAYDANDTNLYSLDMHEHIEFLDIEKESSPQNLSQPWELVTGKKYEVIVTTNDGSWRYKLGDIVEVAGFNPTNGQPLIRYCERIGVGFRIAGEFVPQSLLQDIMASLSDTLGSVLEFTTTIDERKFLRAYGFFVELDGELGPNPTMAIRQVNDALLVNEGYKKYLNLFIGEPTIRIVAPGTFKAYREWKTQAAGSASGQIKVPVTTVDNNTKEWLAKRVIGEVGV